MNEKPLINGLNQARSQFVTNKNNSEIDLFCKGVPLSFYKIMVKFNKHAIAKLKTAKVKNKEIITQRFSCLEVP